MKKRTAKIVSLCMIGAFTISLFTACGSTDTSDTTENTSASAETSSTTESSSDAASSDGDVYELSVQSQDPETGATGQFLEEWAAAIEEASDGRLEINIYHGGSLGSGSESYNMVTSGQVDIAWGLPSMSTGKFPLTDVAALPFTAEDTLQASYALWDLYDTTDYLDEEWSEVKVLLLHTNCDSPLLLKDEKAESISDLKGRSIRFIGGVSTNLGEDMGITPVSITTSDIYSSLEKGVVDGAANCGWDIVSSFRLYEQADYILDWHMNVNPYYLVMNVDSYNSLPSDLQAIIDEYSGEKALEYVGTKWQDVKSEVMEEYADMIYTWSDDEQAAAEEMGLAVAQEWIEEISEDGTDGQGLYDAYIERLEKYESKIAE